MEYRCLLSIGNFIFLWISQIPMEVYHNLSDRPKVQNVATFKRYATAIIQYIDIPNSLRTCLLPEHETAARPCVLLTFSQFKAQLRGPVEVAGRLCFEVLSKPRASTCSTRNKQQSLGPSCGSCNHSLIVHRLLSDITIYNII
jgi:hypothetical protein